MPDLGLARHEQRVGEKGASVLGATAVYRDLGATEERQRLAGNRSDRAVKPRPLPEVTVGLVEPAGKDLPPRLAA